ncbi:uncharacterized protein EDB91DRAFT_1339542 [Suillus paluster]|uniref:uncharacterized protein n=1 Tax=Suillus paluster TaxID=48578 RepID=UPI001B872155|nr:uncharacterized protein EDB91DRAFT_1339542 [Suillus paluster]KAG1726952.1 hypothetical protein EDB91DRAFT_1339542 [Suillus paluster]
MEPTSQIPLFDLPTELVLCIIKHAARPTFDKSNENPYSSALSLCRVSRILRHVVLPELLHTVLLPEYRNVAAFVRALRLQNAYAQQGNDLHFDYAARVGKIWIGKICEPPSEAPLHNSLSPHAQSEPDIDFSVLGPVLLSAPSLALDFGSLWLLSGCLESAWDSHIDINNRPRECSPRSTKALTLVGDITRWDPLTSTAKGSVFLAAISHLTFLSQFDNIWFVTRNYYYPASERRNHPLPKWMTVVPWASFQSLHTVSAILPFITIAGPLLSMYQDTDVEMLTLSVSSPSGPWVHKTVKEYTESGEGRLSSVDVRLKSGHPRAFNACYDWEEGWACGLL